MENSEKIEAFSEVGIIGAGAMGRGIAQSALAAGHSVLLYDTKESACEEALKSIEKGLLKFAEKGKIQKSDVQGFLANLQLSSKMQDLSSFSFFIEAVIENMAIKLEIFHQLEKMVSAEAVFASNTSSLAIGSMARHLKHAERLVGMHFFNPAALMKLVEIVKPVTASDKIAKQVYQTAKAWGKYPIYVADRPGFLANRAARPYYSESLRMAEEAVASIEEIDAIQRSMMGFRMGAFELMDFIGHDVNYPVSLNIYESYFQKDSYRPSLLQKELLESGFLGRKTGRGFYKYNPEKVSPQKATLSPLGNKIDKKQGSEILSIELIGMKEKLFYANDFIQLLEEKKLLQASLQENSLDSTMKLPEAFFKISYTSSHQAKNLVAYLCPGRGLLAADEAALFQETVILYDYAESYIHADRLCFSLSADWQSSNCGGEASYASSSTVHENTAAGLKLKKLEEAALDMLDLLSKKLGKSMIAIQDSPGQVSLRLLSVMSNHAISMLDEKELQADDLDAALCLGFHYPKGLLQWADAFGLQRLNKLLTNLSRYYNENRYYPCLHLQKKCRRGEFFTSRHKDD